MGRKALAKSASERSSVEYGKHFVIIQPWGLRDGDGVTDAAEGVVARGAGMALGDWREGVPMLDEGEKRFVPIVKARVADVMRKRYMSVSERPWLARDQPAYSPVARRKASRLASSAGREMLSGLRFTS